MVTQELGEHYELSQNMYKPYACGLVVHATIDGCLQLREEHHLKPEDIDAIALTVCPRTLQLTGNKTPRTGLEGKFSVYHVAAAAMVFGIVSESQFSDASVLDPRVIAVRERDSGIRAAGECSGNAGHHLKWHTLLHEGFNFFTAPTKNKRVATF